jgi:hypothetical protein
VSQCMARIDWAATRCWISWSLGVPLDLFIEKSLREGIELRDASQTDIEAAGARLEALNEREQGEQVAPLRHELARNHAEPLWRIPHG